MPLAVWERVEFIRQTLGLFDEDEVLEHAVKLLDAAASAKAEGETIEFEIYIRGKDGTRTRLTP